MSSSTLRYDPPDAWRLRSEARARMADVTLVPNLEDRAVPGAAPLDGPTACVEPARRGRELLQGREEWSGVGTQMHEGRGQRVNPA